MSHPIFFTCNFSLSEIKLQTARSANKRQTLKNENSNRKNTELPTSQRKKIKEEQKLDINHYKRRQRANSAEKWGKKIVACVVLFSFFFFANHMVKVDGENGEKPMICR